MKPPGFQPAPGRPTPSGQFPVFRNQRQEPSPWLYRHTFCSCTAICCSLPGFWWSSSASPCRPRPSCWLPERSPPKASSAFPLALLVGIAASLAADSAWFLIGRRYGHHVLRILCKLSLEPTTCVRKTQDSFGRRRGVTLMIAKFIPGLATLAPPVAGENGMGFARVPLLRWHRRRPSGSAPSSHSAASSATCSSATPSLLDWTGRFSGALLLLGVLIFLVGRLLRRRMILKELAAARLEPEELKRQLDAGESVFIVDLRHPA